MLQKEREGRRLRFAIFMMLALLLSIGLSAGGAFAGAPTSQTAGPPIQGKSDQAGQKPALSSSGKDTAHQAPALPASPNVVLYDQYNNAGPNGTSSQDFEAANDPYDTFTADDFVVPAGQTWNINGVDVDGIYFNGPGPAASFNVYFYNNAGTLPGSLVASRLAQPYTGTLGDAVITISPQVSLAAGTYWVSVQARQDFTPAGQWGWTNRTVLSNNPAAWQNPGGGFALCPTWGIRTVCVAGDASPDQVFRLNGTIGGATPSASASASASASTTAVTTSTASRTASAVASASASASASATVCSTGYSVITGTAALIPGTTLLTGTQCDDCSTAFALPFPVQYYGQTFSTVNVISNGNLQFSSANTTFSNVCLPAATHNNLVAPFWDDLDMRTTANPANGVYTTVLGTAPNRQVVIEYRACLYNGGACALGTVNFEVIFTESSGTIEFRYGAMANRGTSATIGVQRDTGSQFTQYSCNTASVAPPTQLIFTPTSCGSATASATVGTATTSTRTVTAVSTGTRTATAQASGTVCAGGPIVFNGALAAGDPTLATRMFRADPASTCAAPHACPGPSGTGPFLYDTYTFTNTTGAPACVNINLNPMTCEGTTNTFLHASAYLGAFDPSNVCTSNYLGDIGASPQAPKDFSVTVPAGGQVTIVVNGVTANGTCPGYQVTVTGAGGGGGCGGSVTPTRTVTPTVCIPSGGWTSGPVHPASPGIVRAVGVYFPANGKFYTMGGRTSDAAGSDTTNPYEFTPGTPGTWATKSATLPDNQVNNMACGVLTDAGTPYIYCVGGSAAGATTATARVFRYNPVTDAISTVAAPWPGNAGGDTLPGGFAVANNKLYIVGGFQINVAMTNQTWEFTPGTNTWAAKANYPVARGYVPTAAIGNVLYTGGGSDYVGGLVTDTNSSYKYDIASNTWTPITNIPRATGETRAVVLNGEMYVLGGGRDAPNPSNEVDIYNPGTNAWRVGTPMLEARRNFPADSNGTDRIFVAGGYATTTPTNTTEIFQAGGGCPTGTAVVTSTRTATAAITNTATRTNTVGVVTNTATRTNTAVATTAVPTTAVPTTRVPTATACTIEFSDVPTSNPFRIYIKCLVCRGIVSGYSDGTFRPFNDVTRGQAAKMISGAAGFNEAVSGQRYTDVPSSNPFYVWIMRLTNRNIATGYSDAVNCAGVGIPCFRWERPVTRGQLAKMDSNAAGYVEPVPAGTQTFTDVAPSNTFYAFIERLSRRGVISGYECGVAPAGPCDAQRRPYFLPNNNITRGQAAKVVANTFFPECQQPGPQTTPPARPETGGAVNQ